MTIVNLKSRDFLALMDFTTEELETILQTAHDLKRKLARGEQHRLLEGKSVSMIFAAPSTRTRVSFETAMTQLGGHAQYLTPETMQLTNKETWVDTARVLDRYVDGIVMRMYNIERYGMARELLKVMANNAAIPMVNAADDMDHPCQVMADVLTLQEKHEHLRDKKIVMSWAYSDRLKTAAVPQSMTVASGLLGLKLTLAYPEGYDIDPTYLAFAKKAAEKTGGSIEVVRDLGQAVRNADVVYAKSWRSRVLNENEDKAHRAKFKDWMVTEELLSHGKTGTQYMHCAPIDRNKEVTDEVVDGPRSLVFDQAENRLHAQKAVLALILR